MRGIKIGLLGKVVIAIVLGIGVGLVSPDWISRIFITFNGLFSNFLNFIVPLIILGLIAPGTADLGKSAGRLLLITSLLAYAFTIFTGLFAYFSGKFFLPGMLSTAGTPQLETAVKTLDPYFTIELPPVLQ